jgi:hypothetical protein
MNYQLAYSCQPRKTSNFGAIALMLILFMLFSFGLAGMFYIFDQKIKGLPVKENTPAKHIETEERKEFSLVLKESGNLIKIEGDSWDSAFLSLGRIIKDSPSEEGIVEAFSIPQSSKTKYKILYSSELSVFEEAVNKHIENGWVVCGGISMDVQSGFSGTSIRFAQALTKTF